MKKRGSSHIEMIFSFVIFVAAIGFALYFFSPTNSSRLVETSFDYLFREIEKNASSEVFIFSVRINNDTIPAGVTDICFNVSGSGLNYGAVVFDENGNDLSGKKFKDTVSANSSSGWGMINFASIILADEFYEDVVGCAPNENYYDISSSLKKDILSEKKIGNLSQIYYSNYTKLKKQFNIPGRVNFGFSLVFFDGSNITAEKEIPQSLEVFVNQKRIEVLKTDGKTEFGVLTVKVW
jgi:hypothetical protein